MKRLAFIGLLIGASPVAAQDFTGPYAGISLSREHYSVKDYENSEPGFNASGAAINLFAGYNFALGSVIVGPELSLSKSNTSDAGTDSYFADFSVKQSLGLRLRAGLPVGNFMPYVAAGLLRSKVSADHDGDSDKSSTTNGRSLALGVDWALNEKSFLRFEVEHVDYKRRDYDWGSAVGHTHEFEMNGNRVTLGYAMKF